MHGHERTAMSPVKSDRLRRSNPMHVELAESRDVGAALQSPAAAISWENAINAGKSAGRYPHELKAALETLRAEIQLAEGTRARLFRPIRGPRRIRLPDRTPGDKEVRILLSRDGRTGFARRLNQVDLKDLIFCHPMRDFSRRHGQGNKPVAYFSRTVGDLVACESQHERRFAILADWHEAVAHIAAQPFTIEFPPDHELDSHTPDFAVIGTSGAVVVVNVKWPSDAMNPDVVRRHEIVERLLATSGMQHVVWSGAPPVITENLANFAAARVPDTMMRDAAPKLLAAYRPGIRVRTLLEAVADVHHIPVSTGLVVLRRLLWDHQLEVDMLALFTVEAELRRL
jgi:hypothetical protein